MTPLIIALLGLTPTAHATTVLLYEESVRSGYGGDALDVLGYSYTTASASTFTTLVNSGAYDLLVMDFPSTKPSGSWEAAIASHVARGGMALIGYWDIDASTSLQATMNVTVTSTISSPYTLYSWDTSHPIWNSVYRPPTVMSGSAAGWADNGDMLATASSATAVGGYSSGTSSSQGAIVIGNSNRTIYNGFLFDNYPYDADGDGTKDIVELVANEIQFLISGGVVCDADGDGFDANDATCGGNDCDDSRASVYPGATETWYDGIDANCLFDDDFDQDADGWVPTAYAGRTTSGVTGSGALPSGDCDDTRASVNPGATEVPYDGIDQDCTGSDLTDVDGDGYTAAIVGGTDCDDTDAGTYPTAPETADGVDEDCDGDVDDGTSWFDDDGDGVTEAGGDCDDSDASVSPGAAETADGVDEDCDGIVDEGTTNYDDDGDGWSEADGDCNDSSAAISPDALETWGNGIDDNCDGIVDDGATDADSDGTAGWAGDCDDHDASVGPGAPELADGVDNDCDGLIDEGTPAFDDDGDGISEDEGDCNDNDPLTSPDASEDPTNGIDDDCDGVVDEGGSTTDDDGDGFSEDGGDCDDGNPDASPMGTEDPTNGADDDCDGEVDEADGADDIDGDGFGEADGDCDDNDVYSYPGAPEMCDGTDNDCNGVNDDGCDTLDGNTLSDDKSSSCASAPARSPQLPLWLALFAALVAPFRARRSAGGAR